MASRRRSTWLSWASMTISRTRGCGPHASSCIAAPHSWQRTPTPRSRRPAGTCGRAPGPWSRRSPRRPGSRRRWWASRTPPCSMPPSVGRAGLAPRRRGSGREPLEEVRPGRQLPPVTSLPSVPEKQPRYGGPEREPAHVRPVGYAAAHVGAHAANPAEQLEDEPEPQEGDGRELDRGDEEEDDERVDTGMGEQDEVRAQDGGDGPGGPKVRDGGRGSDGELEARGCQAAQQVEDQVQPRFQPILDVVAEDPQVEHVAPDVEPAAVQEHRHEDRQVHVLVWAPLLERPLKLCPDPRPELWSQVRLDGIPRGRPSFSKARLVCDLPWDQCVAVVEEEAPGIAVRLQGWLPEQEDQAIGGDQRKRDPRRAGRGVRVADRDHDRLPPALASPPALTASEPSSKEGARRPGILVATGAGRGTRGPRIP